ncbi:hypothetical protein JQN58_12635 [Aneurinibacillus sp. BA2021]|nr:hypothetical protein [Aneurinibacillus sp. BA2021]
MRRYIDEEETERETSPLFESIAMKLAHEVRNPLTTVRGYLQYFLEIDGAEQEKADIILNILLPELDRVDLFIRDFLFFSRPYPPRKQYIDMQHLIQRFQRHVCTKLALQDTDIIFDLSPEINNLPLYIDAGQIVRVMLSLFINAVEARDDKAVSITIRTQVSHKTVSVCFMDNGRGMDTYMLSRIFDPFFSVKKIGMGLGLPISQKIIAMHGGTINIRSCKGRGTAVMFTLPHG